MPFQEIPAPIIVTPPTSTGSLLDPTLALDTQEIDEQFPVFLFPDVTGDSLSLVRLANQIQAARPGCKVYIWHDPLPSKTERSFLAYAHQIAFEVKKLLKVGPLYFLGYSYGANLAALVAHILTAEKRKVAFTVIDAPSIQALKDYYLAHHNIAATKDLVAIFNYAGNLALYWTKKPEPAGQVLQKPLFPQLLTEELLKDLNQLPIEQQLANLTQHFSSLTYEIGPELHGMMTQYTEVITQNLLTLFQHENEFAYQRLSKILVIESEESRKKYLFNLSNSWEDCSSTTIEAALLAKSTHLSLIKDRDNSATIAQMAAHFFHSTFSDEEIDAMQLTFLVKKIVKKNPKVDFRRLLRAIEDDTQQEAETKSLSDNRQSMPPSPALIIPNRQALTSPLFAASKVVISQKQGPTPVSTSFQATAAITIKPISFLSRSRHSERTTSHRRASSLTRSEYKGHHYNSQQLKQVAGDAASDGTEMSCTLSTSPTDSMVISPASSTDSSTTSSSHNSPASHCSFATEQKPSIALFELNAHEQRNSEESFDISDSDFGANLGPTIPDRRIAIIHEKKETPPSSPALKSLVSTPRDKSSHLGRLPIRTPSDSSVFSQPLCLFSQNRQNSIANSIASTQSGPTVPPKLFLRNITDLQERGLDLHTSTPFTPPSNKNNISRKL